MRNKPYFTVAMCAFVMTMPLLGMAFAEPKPESKLSVGTSLNTQDKPTVQDKPNAPIKGEAQTLPPAQLQLEPPIQQEISTTNLGTLNEKVDLALETNMGMLSRSTLMVNMLGVFATLFGIAIAVVGYITFNNVRKLEKKAGESIAETKRERKHAEEKADKLLERVENKAEKAMSETKNERRKAEEKVERFLKHAEKKAGESIAETKRGLKQAEEKADKLLERVENKAEKALSETKNERRNAEEKVERFLKHAEEKVVEEIKKFEACREEYEGITKATKNNITNATPDANSKPPDVSTSAAEELIKQKDAKFYLRAYAIEASDAEKWQEALSLWERVLQDEPNDIDALFYAAVSLGNMLEGEKYVSNPLWGKANQYLDRLTHLAPNNAGAWYNWGTLFLRQGRLETGVDKKRLWDKASEYFKEATTLDASYAEAWNNLGNICYEQGKDEKNSEQQRLWGKADEYYKEATTLDESFANAWYNWGLLCGLRSELEKDEPTKKDFLSRAAEYHQKAIKFDPSLG